MTPRFDFLQMIALLHPKQHVYAVVCEMINDRWVDLVQYYSDGTQLNATNVKSAPESHVDVPKQRKVREPKWGVTKLADWMLQQPPPASATVLSLKAADFAKHFEEDYANEMQRTTLKMKHAGSLPHANLVLEARGGWGFKREKPQTARGFAVAWGL